MAKQIPKLVLRSRQRSRGSVSPTSYTWTVRRLSDNVIVDGPYTAVGRPRSDNVESFMDSYANAYERRSAAGEIVNTAYQQFSVTSITPSQSWTYDYPVAGQPSRATVSASDSFAFAANTWAFPAGVDYLAEPPGMKTDLQLIDLATIAAKANVVKADTLALVTAAELGKTVSMVTSRSSAMSNGLKLLAQGKPKKAVLAALGLTIDTQKRNAAKRISGGAKSLNWRRSSKTAASRWLEIQYGWLPLIYDVQGALKALSAVNKPRFTARGYANDSGASSPSSILNFGVANATFTLSTVLDKRVRAYILYEVDRSALLPQKLGLLQLPGTLWELATFSFVLDWFIDIGQWLDAITPRVGVKVLAEGYTFEKIGSRSRLITNVAPIAPFTATNGLLGQADSWFGRSKYRHPFLSAFPQPRVNVKFSPKRAIDAIALLRQIASKVLI
jgi:hypothetical protein